MSDRLDLSGAEAGLTALLLDALDSGESPIALLADIAAALPEPLRRPDATPSVPTGASDVERADAFGLSHLGNDGGWTRVAVPMAGGLVFSWLRHRSGSGQRTRAMVGAKPLVSAP